MHSPPVYSVTLLSGTKTERPHFARPLKYEDRLKGFTVLADVPSLADKTELRYEAVDQIVDLRKAFDGLSMFKLSVTACLTSATLRGSLRTSSTLMYRIS